MLSSDLILCRPLLLLSPSLPASESFPMSQLFSRGGQSTGVSALASFLSKKSQGSSSEWTGWISLQSKGLYLALGWLKMLDACCLNVLAAEAQASDSMLACGTGKQFPEALLEIFGSP